MENKIMNFNYKSKVQTSIGIKHRADRNTFFKFPDQWLEDKKKFDGAENLWRIHNSLYDFTNFIDKHPGGKFWIQTTRGLDLTETFESHHISTKPEKLLPKYFVRNAKTPRNSPFTFYENGFYRTLKRNIRQKWKNIPRSAAKMTNLIIDTFFILSFVLSSLATAYSSYYTGIFAGIMLGLTLTSGHNYYHQKDNFRMYYNDIFMLSSRDFRIIHVLSHHALTNSVADIQNYIFEPFLQLHPVKKSLIIKYLSYIYGPVLLWPVIFFAIYLARLSMWIAVGKCQGIEKAALAWLLPLFTYVTTNQSLLNVLLMWIFIISIGSQCFCWVGFTTNHCHEDIFMDGDTPRSDMDWGVNQLDTVGDKTGIVNAPFLGLIFLGDHALHHLFPSLDHGVIQQFYPVFQETLEKFNLNLRVMGTNEIILGYFSRLSHEKPNSNPPNLTVKKIND